MMIVADNLHIIDPVIADAVARLDPAPIDALVRRCQRAGAQAIDINSGPLPKAPARHFAFLVQAVQDNTSLPLMLDTTNPVALEAGLRICRNRAIINGFSLEPAKLERILPLAAGYDADVIGYLLGPNSQVPIEQEEISALAVELFETFSRTGLGPDRLIIDPVIAPVSWDNGLRHNQAVLKVIAMLPDLLGVPVRTVAGLSNLASGPAPRARKIELERTFLPMLAAAGLDMVLLNVFHEPAVQTVGLCNALLGDNVFAWGQATGSGRQPYSRRP
jgi:5-methyltetrahydrofolate corrinoid/iron sulfur protein methyltransferase